MKYLKILLVIIVAASCSKEEFEEPDSQGTIDSTIFGATFNRFLYQSPNDSLLDKEDFVTFPTLGVPESFDALYVRSSIRNREGIRKAICEIQHNAFFLDQKADHFFAGYKLGFELNIQPTTDVIDTVPFQRDVLESFLTVGKTYYSAPDSLGTIQMSYQEIDGEEQGLVTKNFVTGELGAFPALNAVTITGIEEYENTTSNDFLIDKGFRVSVDFRFTGSVRFQNQPFDYFFCELQEGKADFYIAFRE